MSDTATFNVGGLRVTVYNLSAALSSSLPVGILIAAHGRLQNQSSLKTLSKRAVEISQGHEQKGEKARRSLVVVTLTQRNHDERMVDKNANNGFEENPMHALDMYAVQTGTARDVSFLIDFLPAYLFPNGEKHVEEFFVTGVSLGGHSTWINLRSDPRIRIGIPIIGCPDYHSLLSARISTAPIPSSTSTKLEAPHFPDALSRLVSESDPCNVDYESDDPKVNPYIDKKILVLCGADDTLVPATFTKKMFDGLDVGKNGAKEMIVEQGKGHEVSDDMKTRLGEWIWKYGLSAEGASMATDKSSL